MILVFVTEFVISADEEKHIAAVQKAMEERGMLDHTIVHGVFVGPARSGKNSLMERLLGRMPSSVSPSTGVAESVVQVKVIQKSITIAANVEESIWSIMDYDDEAIKLMLINSESKTRIEVPVLQTEDPVDTLNPNGSSEASVAIVDSDLVECNDKSAIESEPEDEWFEAPSSLADDQPIARSSYVRPCPKLPDSYISPIEIVKVALRKKGKKGLEILQQHFQKTWSLYLTNTGGQMEFQEVLPLLVSGPSMFFFTFRLDRDINERYIIEYELSDGTSAKPYTSSLTIVEGLLQTLATIAAMGTFVYKGLLRRKVPLRPKVFIIGTHKDKLDSKTVSSDIAKIDQQLQAIIQSTSHCKHLIEYASPSQLIFAVNNFSESDADFKNIRSAVEQVIVREEFQMTSPAHWLIFSLALRSIKPYVISYNLCLEVARQCGLSDNELDEALHFIHSKMGLIRYFPYEDVKDLVVIHPQFLFDKVTELIVDTFTFERAGKHSMDEFKQKGIFSLGEFEDISTRNDTSMKPFQFARLLERLRIAAPFEMDGNRMYFFPCVLAHTAVATDFHELEFASLGPKLMIAFKCGYCPKGLAGAVIKYLMANEMGSTLTWELVYDCICRNMVCFTVGPLDVVVLKLSSTHLEVIVWPQDFENRSETCPLSKICCAVRETLEAGIRQVTADINYVDAHHYVTFPCGCKGDHPGILNFFNGAPYCLTCGKTNKKFKLPAGYKLWKIPEPDSREVLYKEQSPKLAKFPKQHHSAHHHQSALNLPESQEASADQECNGKKIIAVLSIMYKPLINMH